MAPFANQYPHPLKQVTIILTFINIKKFYLFLDLNWNHLCLAVYG